MQKKIKKKFFVFEITASKLVALNCLYLKREYLLSFLSVLGNSLEILHITNREFLQVNCLDSDQ